MKTNILKSFVAMLAIAATVCFAGCKDDESDEDIIPNIAIAESTMSFTNAEETKTLALESNADWQAVVPESADWVTVNPMSGNGDKTVTIAVAENTTGKAREAEVKFSALHPTYGVYDTKKLTIIQSANETEVEEESVIYSDGFDNGDGSKDENNAWPAVVDRANPQGSAAANVTYEVSGKVTVRNSGKASNDSDYSNYKGSGVNKVFFGTIPASLVVENIALPADQQNYVLSFGANHFSQDAADNTFKNEELLVYISKNGEAWAPIEYSFAEGADLNGKWNLAEASFKLAEVPEALYIKFDAKISSIISIDDIALATGGAGEQEITLPTEATPEVVEKVTVQEFLDAPEGGLYELTGVIKNVKNNDYGNFDLEDETASVYVYGIYDESGAKIFTAKGLKAGDTVTLKGVRTSYNGTAQVGNAVYISHVPGEGGDEPAEEWGDDERYLSDEGLVPAQGTADFTNKFYGEQVIIEEQNYPALKLGTSSVVGTWTTEALGVEGDYTLSFYAFAWNNKPGQLVIAVDGETVATIDAEQTAGIANNTPYTIEVDQEKNHYTVELTGLTAESTITFSTTEGKTRVVLCGIKLAAPAAEPVEMTPAAVAEGYQGAKVTWEAVEGAEAYLVYYSLNGEDEVVEVAKDKTEAVITGLADARKYVFAVEAIDAEENVIGEGETAETEVWTLVNWEEPEFSLTLSDDKTNYVFLVGNLAEPNYIYAGGEIKIYKDGAAEPIYTLKNETSEGWLHQANTLKRWVLRDMNNRKGWIWYKGATDEVVSIKADGSSGEVTSVPASFFTAGEYTLDYSILYAVNVGGSWGKDLGNSTYVEATEDEATLVIFAGKDNVLYNGETVYRHTKTNGETPVALATIEATLEFTSVTAKAEGYQGAKIEWSAVETADAYKVVVNGTEVEANGELSHTVAPETLTDANEYTFTVKAYKGADLLAQKDVKTQVWTLVNTPEPVVTFVDGVLKATNLVDVTGVALKMTVTFTKEGAAEAAYTAYSEHYFNSTSDISVNINTDQKFKFADFDTFTKWTWDGSTDKANATDAAQSFEPGTYKVTYTAQYYPIVGGYWTDQSAAGSPVATKAEANRIKYPAAESVYQTYVAAEGEADDVVIADPSVPEPVEMTPAAVAEGYQGAKISWEAVEGAETYTVSVVGNDAITPVEVAGDKTEAVITGLADARKYVFAVEAIDAEENVIGEGETAETEIYTLFDYAPEFEIVKQDDGSWKLNMYKLAYEGGIFRSIAFTLKEKGSDTVLYSENGTEGETGFILDASHFGWANNFYTPWRKQTSDDWSTAAGKKLAGVEFKHNTTYVVEYTAALTPGMVALTLEEYAGPDSYFNIANYEAGTHVYYKSLLRRDNDIPTTTGTMEFTTEAAPVVLTATAAAEGYQGAKVVWNAIEGATGYEVSVAGTKVADAAADATSAVVTDLTEASKYVFTVKAVGVDASATTDEIEIYSMADVAAPEFEFVKNDNGTYDVKIVKNAATLRAFFVNFHINYKDSQGNYLFDEAQRASGGYLDSSLPIWIGNKVTGYDNFSEGDGVMKGLELKAGETYTVEYTATYAFIIGATVHSDGSRKLFTDNTILKKEGGLHGLYTLDVPGTATFTTEAAPEPEPEKLTIAEFLALSGDDVVDQDATDEEIAAAPLYILEGTITEVKNTQYGNFNLTDDTGTVYIYGLCNPEGTANQYWATSGAKLGDDIVIKTIRTEFSGSPQGKNARFVELVSPGTRAFWNPESNSVTLAAAGESKTVKLNAYNLDGDVTVTSNSDAISATYADDVVTISADANDGAVVTAVVTVSYGNLSHEIAVTQLGQSSDGAEAVTIKKVMSECGWKNAEVVSSLVMDDNISIEFAKGGASTAPTYYDNGTALRLYQKGAYMTITASNGKIIKAVNLTFDGTMNYLVADCGTYDNGSWTGETGSVKFTCNGTDSKTRAYITSIEVVYE